MSPAGELRSLADVVAAGMTGHKCRVPGNFELDLERLGVVEAPFFGMNTARLRELEHCHVFYARRFTCKPPRDLDAELVLEGVDCFAQVYLNGEHLGSCDNMLVEQVFEVTGRLRNGQNELFVHIRPAVDEAKKYDYPPTVVSHVTGMESVHVRKAPHMYGWDIMPRIVSAGLWRPVSIRFLPKERLQAVCLTTVRVAPDRGSAHLGLHVQAGVAEGSRATWEVAIRGGCGKSEFEARRTLFFAAGRFDIHVGKPALWWPRGRGEANLYDVQVSLLKDGQVVDTREFRFGIRTVELLRTSVVTPTGEGEFCLKINGERVFAKGSNWVPLDAFHSRDLGRTRRALDMAADLDCNILRCWGGNVYESDLFYELCDELGIMIWQDFAMACALYPQDAEFCRRLEAEARQVVRRLRNHACIVIWAGDNECDCGRYWWWGGGNPNDNVLTRKVLPDLLRAEDPFRPYLPSSPYIDETGWKQGEKYLSENHLWGPRDYYKSDFYRNSLCCFASEIGYHGCPDPESIREFISPDKVWPRTDNEEWNLHSTCPVPGFFGNNNDNSRVELMAKQIRELFGTVPARLEDFAFASQASQAEAKKFFIEFFRGTKWRRTGIIWWNLLDGWPQFSDAIVDYYFRKKLAYRFIKASQQHLCLMLREPANWGQELVACNDRRDPVEVEFSLHDVDSGEALAKGRQTAAADSVTVLARIPFSLGAKRFYAIDWRSSHGRGRNHYLAGMPPFDLKQYREWLEAARIV
ncbi:MAG: hypothetical protein A3K19_10455 [Lentisphaerae bacterium RIFOXYB12_FULL_65_16]|nr:MAG: hypothetical protein A3K18_32315 [Lentisphaerae bacterium RIFOXYA12_64_32]OGV91640.1 MAG: hypothetical protein A3K19_10455 [Lentisphaerae bacterium RIFOXYB12_FULL_65_16]